MALRAVASRPTSVPSSLWGTRRARSPPAMASAVRSMSVRGRSPTRTSHRASRLTASRATAVTISSTAASLCNVLFRPVRGLARMRMPRGRASATVRYRVPPPVAGRLLSNLTDSGEATASLSVRSETRGGSLPEPPAGTSTRTAPDGSRTLKYVMGGKRARRRTGSENSDGKPAAVGRGSTRWADAGGSEGVGDLVFERARSKGPSSTSSCWSRSRISWRRRTL